MPHPLPQFSQILGSAAWIPRSQSALLCWLASLHLSNYLMSFNSAQCYVAAWMGEVGGRMDTSICMAQSLCDSLETISFISPPFSLHWIMSVSWDSWGLETSNLLIISRRNWGHAKTGNALMASYLRRYSVTRGFEIDLLADAGASTWSKIQSFTSGLLF